MEYMAYHINGSTVFWAEGLPLDASPPEFAGLLRHLQDGLQIPIDHYRTLQHIQRHLQKGTPTTRLPYKLSTPTASTMGTNPDWH
jgi:hypothetical protein